MIVKAAEQIEKQGGVDLVTDFILSSSYFQIIEAAIAAVWNLSLIGMRNCSKLIIQNQ